VRISVPISVANDSDVELVRDTLLEAAQGVENVLDDPKPSVQLSKIGGTSLDFRLLVWTASPRVHPQTRSDINFRIERLFRERKIAAPSSQPVVQINLDKLESHADDSLVKQKVSSDEQGGQD
jgi:small-conductance mechanosensitive channel